MDRYISSISRTKLPLSSLILLVISSRYCFMMETTPSQGISEISQEETYHKEVNCNCILKSRPADCEEVMKSGHTASGVYTIWPKSRILKCERIKVYCDMETHGGGWTVIQRRGLFGNPENLFSKTWESYKRGFGDLTKEFWLGNDNIYAITNQASYSVRFELLHENGTSAFAWYDNFWIDRDEYKYKLHLGDYSGTAGDALRPHNEKDFYTNYKPGSERLTGKHEGGWWYDVFPSTNLNARNRYGMDNSKSDGIAWYPFGGRFISLQSTEIKIRAMHF